MRARSAMVPAVNIGSNLGPLLIFASIILSVWFHFTGLSWLIWIGIGLFSLSALFALFTLPVELDASRRAMQMLTTSGLVDRTESGQARAVLNAAAWTYVAGLATAVLQLIYYITLAGRRR
jgi:Zn-dependent membrane protease YugP